MSGNHHQWMKFWPADWQNDAALATCSIAARGLWIGMICVMHNAEPYGHLTVNGKPATTRHIAAIARVPEKEAARLIAELEDAGVFSRSEGGTIYSRRMVRDAEQSEAGREAVSKRWGKSKAAKVTTETPPEANSPPNRVPDRDATSTPNTLEAEADTEAEKKEDSVLRTGADAPPADARSQLWSEGLATYRRLTGKGDGPSRSALGRLCKTTRDDCATVLAALREADDLRPLDPMAWLTRRCSLANPEFRNGFLGLIASEGMEMPARPASNPVTAFLEASDVTTH